MIAHFGTFDVANYGDLLFPLVLEKRLGGRLGKIVHASPIGGPAPIALGVESVAVATVTSTAIGAASTPTSGPARASDSRAENSTGVIVGGGHLIHASPSNVEAYRATHDTALRAYPSLWLGAAHHALQTNSPLIWNGPGIPSMLGVDAAPVLAWATSFCDYVALRDERSRSLLFEAGFDGEAEVIPDTGLDVHTLFTEAEIDIAFRRAFETRQSEPARAAIAIHANSRYLGEEPGLVAARLDRLCTAADGRAILLGLGGCHGDAELALAIGGQMRTNPLVVDAPASLLEIVSCIARSRAYLGSSLHGCITACAFGVPAAIVAREGADGGKFRGFLARFDLSEWLLEDWGRAEARARELLTADPAAWRNVASRSAPSLDRHWSRLEATLNAPPQDPERRLRATERFSALQRDTFEHAGIYATLLPHQAGLAVEQQHALTRQRQHAIDLKASYRAAARKLRLRIEELEAAESRTPDGESD